MLLRLANKTTLKRGDGQMAVVIWKTDGVVWLQTLIGGILLRPYTHSALRHPGVQEGSGELRAGGLSCDRSTSRPQGKAATPLSYQESAPRRNHKAGLQKQWIGIQRCKHFKKPKASHLITMSVENLLQK